MAFVVSSFANSSAKGTFSRARIEMESLWEKVVARRIDFIEL